MVILPKQFSFFLPANLLVTKRNEGLHLHKLWTSVYILLLMSTDIVQPHHLLEYFFICSHSSERFFIITCLLLKINWGEFSQVK